MAIALAPSALASALAPSSGLIQSLVPGLSKCGTKPTPSSACMGYTCVGDVWVERPAASTTKCSMGCTVNGHCDGAGSCVGGTQVHCVSDACTKRTCNGTGTCSITYKATTTACDDGNLCTYSDHCDGAGRCGGAAITCSSSDPCTARVCNGTSTCAPAPTPTTTPCDDGNLCTYSDHCDGAGHCGGTAITCSSSDQCTDRVCNGTSTCAAVPKPATTPCNDGNLCTYSDQCNGAGVCAGTAVTCPTGNGCITWTCNGTAKCTPAPSLVGRCDDGEPCTYNDHCIAGGGCVGTPVTPKDDGNPCTVDSCQGGAMIHAPGNKGALCRNAMNDCSLPSYCDGTSATCPADPPAPAGLQCGGDADCGCNGSGMCVFSSSHGEYCYDETGTMSSMSWTPAGAACRATCH